MFEHRDTYRQFAINDKKATLNSHGIGLYQCYCKVFSSKWETLKSKFKQADDDVLMCYEYQYHSFIGMIYSNGVATVIIIMNYLIRNMFEYFVTDIGFHYLTEELTSSMQAIFITQFVNTGMLLIIANANFENTPLSFLPAR